MSGARDGRNYGLDLMRCVAMIMVVILHYLGKGGILVSHSFQGAYEAKDVTSWFLEALCIVAVNLYMLMSGYLLSAGSFKLSRLLGLVVKIWLYSVIVGFAGIALGTPTETVDTYFRLRLLLPISMNTYWFMTAYVLFYCLVPVLSMAAKDMDKKKMQVVIGCLLFFHVILKTILPVKLENDAIGMDAMWYIVLFFIAAYIRRFVTVKKTAGFFVGYVLCAFLITGESLVLRAIYLKTGSLSYILGVSYDYNHIFVLAGAVMLFMAFLNLNISEKAGRVFAFLGKYSLGVYLLHENLSVRYYWESLLWSDKTSGVIQTIVFPISAGIIVFLTGVIIDFITSRIAFRVLAILKKAPVFKSFFSFIGSVDMRFAKPRGDA